MHGGPHRGDAIKKSPSPQIATGSRPEPFSASAAPTEMPGPPPTTAAAVGADIVERMAERDPAVVPRQRQVGVCHHPFAEHFA